MNKLFAFILSLFGIKEQATETAETVEVEAPKAPVVKKVAHPPARPRGRPAPRGGAILLASDCRGLLVKRMH